MKKVIVLAGVIVFTLAGFGEPAIKDRSVIGWWRFDDPSRYGKDSSGYSATDVSFSTSAMSGIASGSFDGSGFLEVTSSGSVSTTLGGGQEIGEKGSWSKTYDFHTIAFRYKSACTLSLTSYEQSKLSSQDQAFVDKINDHESWHQFAMRYKKGAGSWSDVAWQAAIDPVDRSWWDTASRADVSNNTKPSLPVSVVKSTITFGGSIGISSKTTTFLGAIDDVMVIRRLMTVNELSRLYQTGETYVYPLAGVSFAGSSGWSSEENNWKPKPGDMKGASYIVDGGKTLTQSDTATFGSSTDNQISLTLGRLAPLVNQLNSQTLVSNTQGNFTQSGSGTAITFYDLRLNDGTYTAGGTSLTTTLLDVDAPASKPFALAATGDFALNVGEDTTGSGVLAKTGAGKLTVNKWTGTAKLRLAEGSIKTPRLDGYTGGTLLVDAASVAGGMPTVTFTGTDTLSGTIQVQYNGTIAAAEATYPVLNAPTLTSAGQVAITAAIPEKYEGAPKLENGVVSLIVTKKVAPIPDEDKGAKPVLLWQ